MRLGCLLLLLPGFLRAAPLGEAEASVYLAQLAASRPKESVTAVHFREKRLSPMLAKPVTAEGEIHFQPPARFRREVTGGALMVSDGATLWIYSPASGEAERYRMDSKTAQAFGGLMAAFNLQDVEKLFRVSVERETGMHRITLVPKRRAEQRMFDAVVLEVGADRKLRRALWISPDGGRTDMTFSNERRVDSADFDFQPPPGVKVTTPLGR